MRRRGSCPASRSTSSGASGRTSSSSSSAAHHVRRRHPPARRTRRASAGTTAAPAAAHHHHARPASSSSSGTSWPMHGRAAPSVHGGRGHPSPSRPRPWSWSGSASATAARSSHHRRPPSSAWTSRPPHHIAASSWSARSAAVHHRRRRRWTAPSASRSWSWSWSHPPSAGWTASSAAAHHHRAAHRRTSAASWASWSGRSRWVPPRQGRAVVHHLSRENGQARSRTKRRCVRTTRDSVARGTMQQGVLLLPTRNFYVYNMCQRLRCCGKSALTMTMGGTISATVHFVPFLWRGRRRARRQQRCDGEDDACLA